MPDNILANNIPVIPRLTITVPDDFPANKFLFHKIRCVNGSNHFVCVTVVQNNLKNVHQKFLLGGVHASISQPNKEIFHEMFNICNGTCCASNELPCVRVWTPRPRHYKLSGRSAGDTGYISYHASQHIQAH